MTNHKIFEHAKKYLDNGLCILPLGEKSKLPLGAEKIDESLKSELELPSGFKGWKWTKQKIESYADIDQYFHPRINIGVANGTRSGGLIDLDFDNPAAAGLGSLIFMDCPTFGRISSPMAHRVARCSNPGKTEQFGLTPSEAKKIGIGEDEKCMLLEVRSNGSYTMFPPSNHPCGEELFWDGGFPEKIPEVEYNDLVKRAGLCAAMSVIMHAYPKQAGDRDNICLALSGALLRTVVNPHY